MVKQMQSRSVKSSHNHHSLMACHAKDYHRIDTTLHHTNPNNAIHKINANKKISKSPLGKVFNRFIQSIAQMNDSGTFDVSLEIKTIQTDNLSCSAANSTSNATVNMNVNVNENLMRHIRQELEMKHLKIDDSLPTTPKCSSSPYLYRKAKEVYQNFLFSNGNGNGNRSRNGSNDSSNISSREASPRLNKTDDNILVEGFQRTHSQRSSSRSAKLLQFFSCKKQQQQHSEENSINSSNANSPILRRSQSIQANSIELEHDISPAIADYNCNTLSSTNNDSDSFIESSSCEMHSPLIPTYKMTPIKMQGLNRMCYNATELTHFIRSSFHAKRAYVTRLRRSLSEQEYLHHHNHHHHHHHPEDNRERNVQLNSTPIMRSFHANEMANNGKCSKNHNKTNNDNDNNDNDNHSKQRHALANVTNCVNDRTTILRKSDSSGTILSPFQRGVQYQSSERNCKKCNIKGSAFSMTTTVPAAAAAAPATVATVTTTKIITINNNNSRNVTVDKNSLHCSKKNDYQMEREKSMMRPTKTDTNAVLSWSVSFECLLEDIGGLKAFAKFLKLEYSAENIHFWAACERLRHEENDKERSAQAKMIYKKHLANGACEAVNVDSKARNFDENQLEYAMPDIFALAQKQVFNLMKFDSYPRFIRSDLYKNCLQAAEKSQPLPGSTEDDFLDELLKINNNIDNSVTTNASTKLKKSASNAEDRRRKSLLPWHRKTRSKSRERIEDTKRVTETNQKIGTTGSNLHILPSKIPIIAGSSVKILSNQRHNSVSTVYDSRSSLSSCDVLPIISLDAACSLCRIKFTDGATTMVQTKPSETIGQLVERLLEKRGIRYRSYDAIDKENNKPIDLNASTQEIAGKEVEIEQRIAFKLHLPDPKVISVKSKPKKYLFEVVKPILNKYNYDMKMVEVLHKDTQMKIDLLQSVMIVDGQRLQIVPRNLLAEDYQNDGISKKFKASETMQNIPTHAAATAAFRQPVATSSAATRKSTSHINILSSCIASSNLINGLSDDKSSKSSETDNSLKSDDCDSEASSVFEKANIVQDSTKNTPGLSITSKLKQNSLSNICMDEQTSLMTSSIYDVNLKPKKPLIAKLKAGVKVQVTERLTESQDGSLGDVIKKAPLARMEDQRISDVKTDYNTSNENNTTNENMSECLRKARNNLLPINKRCTGTTNTSDITTNVTAATTKINSLDRHKSKPTNKLLVRACSNNDDEIVLLNEFKNPPPPLPPKPKILPIKPSNWGINANSAFNKVSPIFSTPTTPTTTH